VQRARHLAAEADHAVDLQVEGGHEMRVLW
jgi:hypothetical protein